MNGCACVFKFLHSVLWVKLLWLSCNSQYSLDTKPILCVSSFTFKSYCIIASVFFRRMLRRCTKQGAFDTQKVPSLGIKMQSQQLSHQSTLNLCFCFPFSLDAYLITFPGGLYNTSSNLRASYLAISRQNNPEKDLSCLLESLNAFSVQDSVSDTRGILVTKKQITLSMISKTLQKQADPSCCETA